MKLGLCVASANVPSCNNASFPLTTLHVVGCAADLLHRAVGAVPTMIDERALDLAPEDALMVAEIMADAVCATRHSQLRASRVWSDSGAQ